MTSIPLPFPAEEYIDFIVVGNQALKSGKCEAAAIGVLFAFRMTNMKVKVSRPTYIFLLSSSVITVTWKIFQWRARKRAKEIVELAKLRENAPLVSTMLSTTEPRLIMPHSVRSPLRFAPIFLARP